MIQYIENKLLRKEKLTNEETKIFLDHIVLSIKEIVRDDTFINKCDLVQGIVGRYLNKLGVINYPCITNKCIMPNVIGHSFIVATINDKNYIIDPTFIQFACLEFEDLYINNTRVKSKSPYYYASKIDRNTTIDLLTNGYLELNTKTAYLYGNCFYHTLTNINQDYVFSNIDPNVLINSFLNGNETLRKYDYEEIEINSMKGKNR